MKICFLAPANSAHTVKWCNYFVSRKHEVHVISFTEGEIPGVQVHMLKSKASADGGDFQKLMYLITAGQVRRLIREISPDIVNVHYATSYGTVAALAGLKNYVLSVWGSDIFDFPRKSPIHRAMLQFSLNRAKYLFSTSMAMAEEAARYTKKKFEITPFGVDMALFSPDKRSRGEDGDFIIGTVKTLAPDYGIDTLLRAAAIVKQDHPEVPLRVRIAGKGPCEEEYHALARRLGLDVEWLGFISQEQAAREWANMDAAVICSNNESFGVAAVEAQSSGCPVIISQIPGLMEATNPEHSSLVVPAGDANALAGIIYLLYKDAERRKQMGMNGRQYVAQNFEMTECFGKVEHFFETYAAGKLFP